MTVSDGESSFGDWNPTDTDSVPDTSVSDGIPWPALTAKFSPSKITQTASSLVAECLSPSAETNHNDFSQWEDRRGKAD